MYFSYLFRIYFNIISVLFVCCQQFSHQNSQNLFSRRVLRPNSEHSFHAQHPSQQNALFHGRAHPSHPRTQTIGFEDRVQRPPEIRLPSRESTPHARQQMPYQSSDPYKRQHIPQLSHERQKNVNSNPQQILPKYIQKSESFQIRSMRPQIIQNNRHLRIQSPLESEEEYEDELQNIDRNNQKFREIQSIPRGRGQQNFGYNNQNKRRDETAPGFNPPRGFGEQFFANSEEAPPQFPRNRVKDEARVSGFESFSTTRNHKEIDKRFPKLSRNSKSFRPNHEMSSEDSSEDYPNAPETETEFQRNLNLLPPVRDEEEIRRFNEPFMNPPPQQRQYPPRHQSPDYSRNQYRNPEPNDFYSAQNQQNQNKGNHRDVERYVQNIPQHNLQFDSQSGGPNGQTFYGNNNPSNGFDFRRNNVNKERNRFQPYYGNDFQRHTTRRPDLNDNTFGKPVKKEIQIVREITEILPSDEGNDDQNEGPLSEEHYDPSQLIGAPSPPAPPNMYSPFEEENFSDNSEHRRPQKEDKKVDNFFDDEERQILEKKSLDSEDDDSKDKKNKSKFEKEVDLSSDDLENYFDKEFSEQNKEDEEGQKRIEFDDEPKESVPAVAKKGKEEENKATVEEEADNDVEAEYKTATDFLKNHDDFLNKIENENKKFREKTEDKVEKEGDDEESDTVSDEKAKEDNAKIEKELDSETEKKDEEVVEDKDKTDQKTEKEDNGVTEDEVKEDLKEESKDKKESDVLEAEDDEESESKEVTEKEGKKDSDNTEDNKQNEEKNEEQEEDNVTKDEEKKDKEENDETNESLEEEKETKSDKCLESNCDKELLKEESKESKNTQKRDKEGEDVGVDVGVDREKQDTSSSSAKTKPIESKANKAVKISQIHSFAPFFIDLKRINPNKSNIRKGLGNNESQTSWTTSATTSADTIPSPKQRNASIQSKSYL